MEGLDALQTLGLVLREADGQLAVDLINFVMVTPERGFLTVTTDFAPSSHLVRFTLSRGVEEGVPLIVTVDYFTPALTFDPQTNTLFFPDGGSEEPGVYVLDGTTGELLVPDPIPTGGRPTDLVVMPKTGTDTAIPTVSDWGLVVAALLLLAAATVVLARRAE